MKKTALTFLSCFLLISAHLPSVFFSPSSLAYAKSEIPEYAKWSRLALQKTMEKYPDARVVDYLYLGNVVGTASTAEHFKLWLKKDNTEFGVIVTVEYDTKTKKLIDITFKKTSK